MARPPIPVKSCGHHRKPDPPNAKLMNTTRTRRFFFPQPRAANVLPFEVFAGGGVGRESWAEFFLGGVECVQMSFNQQKKKPFRTNAKKAIVARGI